MAIATLLAIGAFAQDTIKIIRLYSGGTIVSEQKYDEIDSIVFVDVPLTIEGVLSGEFSVSATKKVHFSRGNLQASTTDLGTNWTWTFAENQWDYIGNAAANTSINGKGTVSENGTVDLFGWSTSATQYGVNNSTSNSTYSGDFKDWGKTLGNGWFTLSKAEWVYLFYDRADAKELFGMGSVNGVNGIILLPDDWAGDKFTDTESGLTDQGSYYYNEKETNYTFHTYTAEQWSEMESNGAVFLPAAGDRLGTEMYGVGSYGFYWSSSLRNAERAYLLDFRSSHLDPQYHYNRVNGFSVRLVR